MGTLELRLTCLDQLILAREQLEHVDAMNGRVAHVLTDNAVELMLHYQAEQTLQHKWSHPEVTDVSNNDESDYLGRHLKPKLKLAKLLGVLNNEEAEFVLINHEIRNEVYHTGVRHEAVIWDIGWHYHSFACSFLPNVKFGLGISWGFGRNVSPRVKTYVPSHYDLLRGDFGKNFAAICDQVATKSVTPNKSLGNVLGQRMSEDIETLDSALDWIEGNDAKPLSRNEIIIESQLWSALFDEERRSKFRKKSSPLTAQQLGAEKLRNPILVLGNFLEPPITKDPVAGWKRKAHALNREKGAIKSLKRFQALRVEMTDLFGDVMRSAGALENHLDQLRGK
jgi:hypothetical protein